jgi:large subunit ribosomal protein L32e
MIQMAGEKQRLLRARVAKRASFKRDGEGKKKQLSGSWRRPRGLHNKQRRQKKAKGPLPTPGFGSPVAVRGMHPSGYYEVRISTPGELKALDPHMHAVRIAGSVGNRKRLLIQQEAVSSGLKVLNAREIAMRHEGEEEVESDE